MRLIQRFEDWGVDHLDYVVAFALVFSVASLIAVVVMAVAW